MCVRQGQPPYDDIIRGVSDFKISIFPHSLGYITLYREN